MNLFSLAMFLGQSPAAGAPPVNPAGESIKMLGMFVIMGVMVYVLMIGPQRKRTKELNNLLKSLKKGDRVVTASGIIGTVVSVNEKTVALRSAETKLEVLKSTISEITERSGGESGES
jgi:preprotein translocase subunit YajC